MKVLLSSIYPYAFALLLFIVPFDDYVRAWPNILLIILAVSFPFVVAKKDFLRINRTGIIIIISFLLSIVVVSVLSGNWDENQSIIGKVGIGLGMLLLYLPIYNNDKLKNAIIFSSIAAVIFSCFNILMLIKNTGTFEFGASENPLTTLLIDRLYLGLLSVMSVVISYKSISKKYNPYNRYHLANIIINILFVFLIVARMAILTLIALTLLQFFYSTRNKKIIIITLVATVSVISLAFALNSNLAERFFYITNNNQDQSLIEKVFKREPRTVIWACSNKIVKEEGLMFSGLGFKQARERLVNCYESDIVNPERKEWFLFKRYNTHNQYIDIYLGAGIIALLLFLTFFFWSFIKHRKDYYLMAMLVTFVSFGLIENYFHRQIGAYYFGVLLIFILLDYKSTPEGGEINNEHKS